MSAPAGKKAILRGGEAFRTRHVRPCREEGPGKRSVFRLLRGRKKALPPAFSVPAARQEGGTCGMGAEHAFMRLLVEAPARKDAPGGVAALLL